MWRDVIQVRGIREEINNASVVDFPKIPLSEDNIYYIDKIKEVTQGHNQIINTIHIQIINTHIIHIDSTVFQNIYTISLVVDVDFCFIGYIVCVFVCM